MDDSEKFRSIVSTILGVSEERVTDDLSAETVDTWDSLNHINLLGALEQEFDVTLATEKLGDSQSVPRLKALLAEHGIAVQPP